MQEAREALANEIDIIRMLQTRRFYHLAFKHLLDAPIRKQIEQQSEYTVLGGKKSRKASHFVNREVIQNPSNSVFMPVYGHTSVLELDEISETSKSTAIRE